MVLTIPCLRPLRKGPSLHNGFDATQKGYLSLQTLHTLPPGSVLQYHFSLSNTDHRASGPHSLFPKRGSLVNLPLLTSLHHSLLQRQPQQGSRRVCIKTTNTPHIESRTPTRSFHLGSYHVTLLLARLGQTLVPAVLQRLLDFCQALAVHPRLNGIVQPLDLELQ